ncbi:unnamed protein product [Musa acuminata subsp. burmannicoides]
MGGAAGAAVRGAWERRGTRAEQGKGQSAKLGNQIAIASTMVGLMEGMVYAQLYVSLTAHGEGELGIQALILAIERLNNSEFSQIGV